MRLLSVKMERWKKSLLPQHFHIRMTSISIVVSAALHVFTEKQRSIAFADPIYA
ncbi:MAG: hypothetical protein K0S28_2467 [Paucimonas sp.]|nr:hypothetical protein [Paucimonas sp.]